MSSRILATLVAGAIFMSLAVLGQESGSGIDRQTGLIRAEGWELVRTECTECHSARLIVQTRGSREQWLGLLRWMRDTQDLRELEPEVEETILGYLAANYGLKGRRQRRRPLAVELLPPPG